MSSSRAEHASQQAFVTGVFAAYQDDPRVRFVDVSASLCDETTCFAGTASAPYYIDDHHISATAALRIGDALTRQLSAP
jgi:hypothetical protein